jgi:hypothetical protein
VLSLPVEAFPLPNPRNVLFVELTMLAPLVLPIATFAPAATIALQLPAPTQTLLSSVVATLLTVPIITFDPPVVPP